MKQIKCGCEECDCDNTIPVPNYVPDGTKVVCEECQAEHPVGEVPETTSL